VTSWQKVLKCSARDANSFIGSKAATKEAHQDKISKDEKRHTGSMVEGGVNPGNVARRVVAGGTTGPNKQKNSKNVRRLN